ncbi:hypothetical protein V6N12_029097 [Hibiscus sabdariffa]|uniref:Uncharacterized protein n=1 Tax=Hibiscus sabdariffa TaxID=183260 RepID=A0ABR2F7U0_9ROSI
MIRRLCETMWLPNTGSNMAEAEEKKNLAIEFNGSRTLRKEVVLKQLGVKRPRNEQKRHMPRSGHLPRFSAEARKTTRAGFKAHALKAYLEYKSQPKEVLL